MVNGASFKIDLTVCSFEMSLAYGGTLDCSSAGARRNASSFTVERVLLTLASEIDLVDLLAASMTEVDGGGG